MISKHIPMRNVKKSSFLVLAKYMENPQTKQERVEAVRVTNCYQQQLADAAKYEIEPTQKLNQRSSDDKTYHFIISFKAGEHPSQDVLNAIEERMCAALGFQDHQRISAVHNDTDNLHIHVAINKIHPETHHIHTPYNDFKTRSAMCLLLEKEYGLEHDNHKAQKTLSENKAADMERHSGRESFLGWIKRECAQELKSASSWQELHQAMSKNGLDLRQKGNGFVISGPNDVTVKASSVDRSLSKAALEKKLGTFEQGPSEKMPFTPSPEAIRQRFGSAVRIKRPGDRPPPIRENRQLHIGNLPDMQISSGKRYEGKPLGSQSSVSTELYGRYQHEQQRLTIARNEALRLAKARHGRLIEDAKRSGRLKRSVIKLLKGPGVDKRYLYRLATQALSAEIKQANAIYKKDREAAYALHKRRTWADWLQFKAAGGDDQALATLRQRKAQQARKKANELYGDKVKNDSRVPGLKPDGVTKEGTIIYRVGESAIRDGGKRLDVSRDAGDDGLHAALLMARHRYGNQLSVNGSFEFKKRIVAVAASRELKVSFTDPELERLRKILVKKAVREREYLSIPYEQRGKAREAGAMWDSEKKSWFVGPYSTRQKIEDFIRVNEEKDNEQRRKRTDGSERGNARRERSSTGNVADADERSTGRGSPATDARTGPGHSRSRGRTGAGDGTASAGGQPGRADGSARSGGGGKSQSNGQRGHSQPHVARPGRQPPPTAKNRLRAMSELGMVRIAGGSEVLLQSNVPDQLEHKAAERADQLRRNMAGAGGVDTPQQAGKSFSGAEKYISEREQKRLKGFDIPKHRGYNSSDKGPFEYAGQRNSGGQTLVLLKRADEIIVKPVSDYSARRLSSLKVGETVTLTPSGSVRTAKGRSR